VIHDEGRSGKKFGGGHQHNTEFATVPLQRRIVPFMNDDAMTADRHVLDEKAFVAEFFDKPPCDRGEGQPKALIRVDSP
jgi:hypothetical protein